jgi:hypothetical protein
VESDAIVEMQTLYPTFLEKEVNRPSEFWLKEYFDRWKLKTLLHTDIELARSQQATASAIKKWFTEVYDKIDFSLYGKDFIGNMDETMISSKSRLLCVVRRSSRYALNVEDENSEHITLVALVTANGDSMAPFVIFPLKNSPDILDQLVKDGQIIIGGQDAGWIDKVKFLHWSKEFIKWVEARRITLNRPDARFLLMIDSHGSRENPEALELLKNAMIDVYTYPGECSHILQALDVFIFGPFKKHYKIQMRSMRSQKFTWKDENVPSDASVRRLKSLLAAVNGLKQACTYTNIQKAFERSGIHPRDVNAALRNPRLNQSIFEEEIPLLIENTPKRKKLSITSQCITRDSVIDAIKARDEEKKRKNIEKNEYKFPIKF